VVVPTEVDAGLSGPQQLSNASASTSHQSTWGAGLLALGGVLLLAGVLKWRLRRGNHAV
jgi:hypothetical protein